MRVIRRVCCSSSGSRYQSQVPAVSLVRQSIQRSSSKSLQYTAVQGLVTFYALFVVAVSLLIDVVSAWVDPRIRYS